MTELESEAMEAEFDTVAGWTEEAVRALGPEYAVPAGCRGSGSEGALRWLADRLDARSRRPGCSTRGRAWAARPGGWRPSAGCARSAPSPWPPPSGPARRLFGLPSVVAPGPAAAVRRRRLRRRLVPRRPLHDVGQGRARWASCGGCCGRRRGSASWSSSPTPRCRRRCRRATSSPPSGAARPARRRGLRAAWTPPTPTSPTARRSGPSGPTPWTPRSRRRHGDDPAFEQAQENSRRVGRLLSDGGLRAWLGVAHWLS